jgi:hypothetical protein
MTETSGVLDNLRTDAPELSDGIHQDDADSGGVQIEDVDERIKKWARKIQAPTSASTDAVMERVNKQG